jgi:hypothetical protein
LANSFSLTLGHRHYALKLSMTIRHHLRCCGFTLLSPTSLKSIKLSGSLLIEREFQKTCIRRFYHCRTQFTFRNCTKLISANEIPEKDDKTNALYLKFIYCFRMRDVPHGDTADNLYPSFVLSQKRPRNFCKSVYFPFSFFLLSLFLSSAPGYITASLRRNDTVT